MKEKKGKQLIGLLVCLVIGGAALGIGLNRGAFKDTGNALGKIQFGVNILITLVVMVFLVLAAEKLLVLLLGLAGTATAEIIPPYGEGQIGLMAVVLCEEMTLRREASASSAAALSTFRNPLP